MSAAGPRTQARRRALQALYQWQVAGGEPQALIEQYRAQPGGGRVDWRLFERLVCGVTAEREALEARLAPCCSRPIERLDPVERAALWIGAWELMFAPEVPWRTAIDEAVSLARCFGAEEGFRLVNATLDCVARALPQRGPGQAAGA